MLHGLTPWLRAELSSYWVNQAAMRSARSFRKLGRVNAGYWDVRVINLNTLDDLADLSESVDVECKLAAGVDGKGRLPREFWPAYSAFA
jgi:hypothetical protein